MAEDQKTALNFNEIKHLLPPDYSAMETSELEKLAGQGDLEAMRKLVEKLSPQSPSFLISDSDMPTPNLEEAFGWVLKLNEKGDHQGRHWLADCYFSGQYVDKADSKEAIGLLQKNAEEGDYLAYVRLAYYYAHGKGIEQNFRKAIEWLEKMTAYEDANLGLGPHQYFRDKQVVNPPWQFCHEFTYCYEEPRYKLAGLYIQGGFGMEQNYGKAVEWLEKAINWPNIPFDEKCRAQFTLAKCYLSGGPGLEKNYAKAIEWFKEIPEPAKQLLYDGRWGDGYLVSEDENCRRQAQRQLGIYHALGKGVEQDFAEAKKYFEKAARTSSVNISDIPPMVDPRAEAELGICHYRLGEIDKAKECFERSANKNDMLGNLWLAYLKHLENEELRDKYVPMLFRKIGDIFYQPSEVEERSIDIDKIEWEIDKKLSDIAVCLETRVRKEENLNLDMLSVSDEVLNFLINLKNIMSSHPSKIILALYYQGNNNEDYLKYLKRASDHRDVIANYYLGRHYKYSDHDEAEKFLQRVASDSLPHVRNNYPLDERKELRYLAKGDLKDIAHQKEIKAKNLELENMMSMFAHKFRSPLDAIIYNTTHENQPKLYAQAAQTMRGLLDVFSIISTDETVLKNRLMQDMQGDSGLLPVFDNTLNMIMMHSLSVFGAEKIQQHYMSYAKSHGLCGSDISRKIWNEEHYELERQLQTDWEQGYADLLNQSATLEQRLSWIEERFFKLELHGFERTDIQFKAYGITESFLIILLNEILVNAFKYYSSADRQPVRLEWTERDVHHWLICRNPSIRNERSRLKGSGKGHVFLSALARKTGSQFSKPKPLDDFVLEFGIPNELLKTD